MNKMRPSSSIIAKMVRNLLGLLHLNLTKAPFPAFSAFGLTIYRDKRNGFVKERSQYAVTEVLKLNKGSLLDVGSGAELHAQIFQANDFSVECVDYGTSVYAQKKLENGIVVHQIDFLEFTPTKKYDVVWASHVLEHQKNVGLFIEKTFSVHC